MSKNRITTFLKIAAFLVFIGRAYQHLFWDAPYRSFFWDEGLLSETIELLTGLSWYEYATSPATDWFVGNLIKLNGILYLLCTIAVLFLTEKRKKLGSLLLFGSFSLILLAFLYSKDRFYHSAQFLEYSLQIGAPILLYLAVFRVVSFDRLLLVFKLLIAITFTSHGLYAIGVYPVPGKFIDMTISILGVSEPIAHQILLIVGYLDFALSIGIFIPVVSRISLIYALIWGGVTSLARLWANFYIETPLESIHANMFHVVYRLPHSIFPMLVLIMGKRKIKKEQRKISIEGISLV